MIVCRSEDEIARIESAGRIVADSLAVARELIAPGLRVKELDKKIERLIGQAGGRPAFKGYRGYPCSTCVSINEVVVHGIPRSGRLASGDIVGVDVGVELDGYFADAARTFAVGEVSSDRKNLLTAAEKALTAGYEACKVGANLYDVSGAIQASAEGAGYSVVRQFVGHGIGTNMHEEPQIPNYRPKGRGPELGHGMVLALEPMVNQGGHEVKVDEDGWTVVTADGGDSAHFEDTVAVLEGGSRRLTTF